MGFEQTLSKADADKTMGFEQTLSKADADNLQRLQEMFKDAGNVEKLEAVCNELNVPCRLETNHSIPVFRTPYTHDLVVGLTPSSLEARVNHLRDLEATVERNRSVDALNTYILMLPRPGRFDALTELLPLLADESPVSVAKLVLDSYTDTEIFTASHTADWRELLSQHRDGLRALTLPAVHDSLPSNSQSTVDIFHGVEYDTDGDYSPNAWTLSERTAWFFARRFETEEGESRKVLKSTLTIAELNRTATFFTDSRNESEIYFHDVPDYSNLED